MKGSTSLRERKTTLSVPVCLTHITTHAAKCIYLYHIAHIYIIYVFIYVYLHIYMYFCIYTLCIYINICTIYALSIDRLVLY